MNVSTTLKLCWSACAIASVAAAARVDDPRSGFVLVANQQSASASLIDLSTDAAKIIQVGTGPRQAGAWAS